MFSRVKWRKYFAYLTIFCLFMPSFFYFSELPADNQIVSYITHNRFIIALLLFWPYIVILFGPFFYTRHVKDPVQKHFENMILPVGIFIVYLFITFIAFVIYFAGIVQSDSPYPLYGFLWAFDLFISIPILIKILYHCYRWITAKKLLQN